MYWHGTIAADGRRPLCPSDAARLAAVRTLARVGGDEQILFCAADDHVHTVVRGDLARARQLGGNLRQALRLASDAPMEGFRWKEVESRDHLERLVPYVLDQSSHHALSTAPHPALWPGSCFLDLVAARLLPGFGPQPLREALPRLQREDVWAAVHLEPVEPAGDAHLSALGVDALVAAACTALGRTDLAGKEPDAVRGRVVVARLAVRFGMAPARTAEALRIARRTLRDAAALDANPTVERALRLWLAIRAACNAT